ncbi:MAG TPA: hypothetical protein PKD48_07160 [Sphingopyxis sp.]|nr:hypothetical protein [Sphingopyxis sp.]
MKIARILLPAMAMLVAAHGAAAKEAAESQGGTTAPDSEFPLCDGYAAPKGKSDGLSRETFMFGAASRSADIRRGAIIYFGERGLAACEKVLRDGRLIDAFWLRRANLLQAQAVHAIAAGQPERALVLTAQSDALGAANRDSYFAQSVGNGNRGVRAYALIALGRKEEALAEIDGLRSNRPWAQSIRELAMQLHMRLDNSFAAQRDEMRDAIPLTPEKARALFWMQFLQGDYAAARELAPIISFDLPKQRGGWTLTGGETRALEDIELRAKVEGAWAYSEAVAGHEQRAKALIAGARADLDDMMVPPPPQPNGRPPRKQDVENHARRLPHARAAKDELTRWETAIAFRSTLGSRSVGDTQAMFQREGLGELMILPDILTQMREIDPAGRDEIDGVLVALQTDFDTARIKALDLSTRDLMAMLPRPETPKIVPVLKPAGDGFFLSDSGLSRRREEQSDIWTVRYTHMLAPMAAVEELAMFGAAQTARREGYDSLILLSRLSIQRTTHVSGPYTGSYQQNSGYEAQMRVRFVNAGALPADLGGMDWRVIPAQKVIDELSDRYKSGGLTIAW